MQDMFNFTGEDNFFSSPNHTMIMKPNQHNITNYIIDLNDMK